MSSVQQQILSTKFIIRTKPFKIWRNFLELNLAMYYSHLKHEIMFMSGSIRSLDCWSITNDVTGIVRHIGIADNF